MFNISCFNALYYGFISLKHSPLQNVWCGNSYLRNRSVIRIPVLRRLAVVKYNEFGTASGSREDCRMIMME